MLSNNIFHPVACREDVINHADTLAHGNKIKVVRKEVDVNKRLLKRVGRVQFDISYCLLV